MIKDLLLTTDNCRYCLMCRHVCPVAHVTRSETYSPHGWGLTIASIRRGLIDLDDETIDVIYTCADCGTCQAHCVTDQPLPSAIAAMRAEITDKDLSPIQVREVHDKLQKWGNPYGERPAEISVEKSDVALFVGDHAHYLSPGVIDAVLTLLKAVGVEPALIGVGRNNGYLASSLGYPELAASLMLETLDELEAVDPTSMLVLTPGDYYTFSQLHDERNGLQWPDDLSLQEVIPYLSQYLGAGTIHFNSLNGSIPYAYVDPTHSVRVTDRFDAPRRLLDAAMKAPRVELFWRRERTHPSGDGALQYSQPQIASHLAYSRLGDAVSSGARQIITEDSATLSQLMNHSKRFKLEGKNLYELLAEQLV